MSINSLENRFYKFMCPHACCSGQLDPLPFQLGVEKVYCPSCQQEVKWIGGYFCTPEDMPELVAALLSKQGDG